LNIAKFIQGLFDLLRYFHNNSQISSNSEQILDLLKAPGAILAKVHNLNMGVDNGDYLLFLEAEL
jgi:hypothetical protein